MTDYQKYSGAGNKFLIADAVNNDFEYDSHTVRELINSDGNHVFDGVIFVGKSGRGDFKMNYYNKDGTDNALCGNGLRCTAQFIKDNDLASENNLTLEAVDSLYNCTFNSDGTIKVSFPPPNYINPNISLKVHFASWWEDLKCAYVNVGSPHIVVFIEDILKPKVSSLEEVDVLKWGKNIRMHKELMPEGANVNFVHTKQKEIEIRSFERGVEGETLACGTGAVASAIISFINKGLNPPVKVLTRSGDYLVVDFEEKNGEFVSLSLSGPATKLS